MHLIVAFGALALLVAFALGETVAKWFVIIVLGAAGAVFVFFVAVVVVDINRPPRPAQEIITYGTR